MPVAQSSVQEACVLVKTRARVPERARDRARSPRAGLILALLTVTLAMTGCGQRGPLYIPNGGVNTAGAVSPPPPGSPLLSTPLFPGVPLTSDTSSDPAPESTISVVPSSVSPSATDPNSDQPGLKYSPQQP
jgi:hypothetical protein